MLDRPTEDEIVAAVGRQVRHIREEAGLEIEEVAERAKRLLSPAEIAAIEDFSNRDPLWSDYFVLAAAFGVEPGVFFAVVTLEPPTSEDDPGGYVWSEAP